MLAGAVQAPRQWVNGSWINGLMKKAAREGAALSCQFLPRAADFAGSLWLTPDPHPRRA
jgi:hypothetical protein